jgi:site-specific recombinase XerD
MNTARAATASDRPRPRGGHKQLSVRWRLTLSNAITEFIRGIRATKAKATADAYQSDLRRMARHAKLDTVLHFTPSMVRAYFEWESSQQNAAPSTLHRKQAAVRKFARWLIAERIISADQDPMRGIETIRRPEHLPRPFTRPEIQRLWALPLADERHRLFRALLFFTGMRLSAVCAIRLGDIGQDPATITTLGKGGRRQLIHMHPTLAELVVSYVLARTNLKPSTLLLSHDDGRLWRRKYAVGVTRAWGEAAKVRDCTPHRFRHTFGTTLLETTKNLRLVQEAMGHRDIKSTVGYTKVSNEDLRTAIAGLPPSWGGPVADDQQGRLWP